MRRIDDMLLVKELNAALFDHSIQEHHLHAAVSAPSACTEFDYERLELFGDAYLKYLSSIYLFVTNPAQQEGALHSARLRIISNKALFVNAESVGLAPYIQAKPLAPRQWSPPNYIVIPPPPPRTFTTECGATVNDGGTSIGAGADILEVQGDEREKKHDRTSPGVGPDLDSHSVTADDVKSSGSVLHEDQVVEKTSHDGVIEEGTPPDGVPKPAVGRSPTKKSKDDQNVQWLGEKVNDYAISAKSCSCSPGDSRRRRSDHRRGLRYRRERNSP